MPGVGVPAVRGFAVYAFLWLLSTVALVAAAPGLDGVWAAVRGTGVGGVLGFVVRSLRPGLGWRLGTLFVYLAFLLWRASWLGVADLASLLGNTVAAWAYGAALTWPEDLFADPRTPGEGEGAE